MPQFDVYKNPSKRSSTFFPYLVDIQHNYISDIDTRIVLPLGKAKYFKNKSMSKLQISLSYENEELFIITPQISSISRKLLNKPIGSLAHLRQEIIDSLDFAISGI